MILVITGSSRKGGNASLSAAAFISGAESAEHKVSRFDAGRKKITGCMLAPGVAAPGDVPGTDALSRARKMGRNL